MRTNNKGKVRSPSALAMLWKVLIIDMFDSYRPEHHYMRGPGPKWREKHQPAPTAKIPLGGPVEAHA